MKNNALYTGGSANKNRWICRRKVVIIGRLLNIAEGFLEAPFTDSCQR